MRKEDKMKASLTIFGIRFEVWAIRESDNVTDKILITTIREQVSGANKMFGNLDAIKRYRELVPGSLLREAIDYVDSLSKK